ncbi:hypothetical protein RLIN73S_07043 [Rhodanobacter lindaniclasticus]
MRAGRAQPKRPVRPGQRLVLLRRRLRQQLELGDRRRALAVGGAHAIRAGVAATDHHHLLVGGAQLFRQHVAGHHAVLQWQEVHGEVHAIQLAPWQRQVARGFGATGEHHGIELLAQLRRRQYGRAVRGIGRCADEDAGAERHTLGAHLLDAAVDMRFLQLEIGDAVAQQPAYPVILLEYGDRVAGARQLLRRSQAGRAGTDYGHAPAGALRGRLRLHPALFPRLVDDLVLDRLDAHRVVVDVQRARRLARRRADAAGELGEIVGRMQHLDGVSPVLPVDQVIEVRDHVVDRAALVAERDAAVHAARRLDRRGGVVQRRGELAPVPLAQGRRLAGLRHARVIEKAGDLAHDRCLPCSFRP